MGCYVRGDKNSMGSFVRGGKSSWDVLSGMSKNGMGCFVLGCFVRRSCLVPTTMFGLDETKLFMHLCIDVKALSHYDV